MLFQSFGIAQADLAQIDEFIEHARFHNQEYGDNLLVFISKHYGELKSEHSKNHQEERKDHEELPFQKQTHTGLVITILNDHFNSDLNHPDLTTYRSDAFHYQPLTTSLFVFGLLQPPRQA